MAAVTICSDLGPRKIKSDTVSPSISYEVGIHYDNPRGIVLLVDEVVALFNSVKRYSAKSNLIEDLLSRLVIIFLPRSKRLLISGLQSPSAVILEPRKIKSDTFHIYFP